MHWWWKRKRSPCVWSNKRQAKMGTGRHEIRSVATGRGCVVAVVVVVEVVVVKAMVRLLESGLPV